MRRLIAPLVVLALLVYVVIRLAEGPDPEAARARLASAEVREDEVDAFLRDHGKDPANRRAVVQAYLRLQSTRKALETEWPALAGGAAEIAPGPALRAFGEDALRAVALRGEKAAEGPIAQKYLALVSLVDGGDAVARKALGEAVRTGPLEAGLAYFLAASTRGFPSTLALVVEGLRSRGNPDVDVAAAIATLGPAAYPERAADLARLLQALEGKVREQDRPRWAGIAHALGRSGEADATEALRRTAARLAESRVETDRQDGALALAGLLASGDWSVEAGLRALVEAQPPPPLLPAWYARALLVRRQASDAAATEPIRALWSGPVPAEVPDLRTLIATHLFLREEPPARELLEDGVFLRDLTAEGAVLVERVVGESVRLRLGEPTAAGDLVRFIHQIIGEPPRMGAGRVTAPHAAHPSVMAFRALYLYGDSSPH